MADSSETPKGPYFPELEPDLEFEEFLANLKPEDKVLGVSAEDYKEYVKRHQGLMSELAAEADPSPILERWDAMIEEIAQRGSEDADLWQRAKFGVCLWLYNHPSLNHRELALDRARSIYHPVYLMEALILMNDKEDDRGAKYLAFLLMDQRVHPFEQEQMVSALRRTAHESKLVPVVAQRILAVHEEHIAKEEAQKTASEQERLELVAEELGIPQERIEVDYESSKLKFEYREEDLEVLPEEHSARKLLDQGGFDIIKVAVEDSRAVGAQRKHIVRLIRRAERPIDSPAIDQSRISEPPVIVEQVLLERLNDESWVAVQTVGRPPFTPYGSLPQSARGALEEREGLDDLYFDYEDYSLADVTEGIEPWVIEIADQFYAVSDEAARRLVKPAGRS